MKLTSNLQLSGKKIKGWIIRYNQLSKPTKLNNGRLLYLRFKTGTFSKTVQAINAGQSEFRVNLDHKTEDALMQLGSINANVVLEDRPEGVWGKVELLDEFVSDAAHAKLQTGAIGGWSLEADYPKDREPRYEIDGDGNYIKTFDASIGMVLTGAGIVANPRFPSSVAIACSVEQSTDEVAQDEARIEQIEKEKQESLETTVKDAVSRSLKAILAEPETNQKESVETKEDSGEGLQKVIEERDNLQRQVSALKVKEYDELAYQIIANEQAKNGSGSVAQSESEGE